MADLAVLTIALETVRDLLMEEARFLFNVKGEVQEIGTELERMRDFLKRADAKKDEDEGLRYRVTEIRGLAAEVEDVLETFAIEVASQRNRGGGGIIKNALRRSACIVNYECIALHNVGSEIVSIKAKLTNFTNSLQRYDIPRGESFVSTHERQRWERQSFPLPEKNFVGMEDDTRILVSNLVNENEDELNQQCPRVISICGMGGLGKTSLAKKIYHHIEVRRHFDRFSWACVTERCQPTKFLQETLSGLLSENCHNLTDQELVDKLYKVQQENKCLIVIDDIWSTGDWDCLKHAFQNTESGSKILLTSRNRKVATHVDPNGFLHEPKGLSEEMGWELLQKIAFAGKNIRSEGFIIEQKMEDLGREMVKQCWGLPLAVIVLGGILVTKKKLKEWEEVLQNIKRYLAKGEGMGKEYGGERGVSSLLDLSYNNLPYHLKPCFLYLANFPEDSDIKVSKLYHLWVAERIISLDDQHEGETMMDVAEHYLGELAQRYMVQVCVKETQTTRRFKSCRLHDLMRDMCLSKVKEENFLKVIDSRVEEKECSTSSSSSNISKTRRLAVHYSDEVGGYLTSLEKSRARYVRSLLFFEGKAGSWFKENNNVNYFKLLNVLYIGEVDMGGKNFPKALEKIMQQLRYFSLNGNRDIEELPPSLRKLGYLETLDLRTSYGDELFIPNLLWKLKRLRHLYLPLRIKLLDSEKELKKLRLDGLNNLETLVNFDSRQCDAKDLVKLNNLRKLKAWFYREREDMAHLVQSTTSTSSLLRQTELIIFNSFDSEEELNVLVKLLGCHHLNKLRLNGPISKLPESYSFSPNLIRLILTKLKLEDDPMPTLGKLPSLIHLEIVIDVFMGKEMVCFSTDFLQLEHLVIWELPNLENMRVDQGAFPKLSYLLIQGCLKLKMIPDGIKFLTALNELSINHMTREFVDRLQVIDGKEGEDYHKIKHIPSISIHILYLGGNSWMPSGPSIQC